MKTVILSKLYFHPIKLIQVIKNFLIPKHITERMLKGHIQKIYGFSYEVVPAFSGRASIFQVLLALKAKSNRTNVLIPDYVCNIVVKAVKKAGLQPSTYLTDDTFKPIREDLLSKVNQTVLAIIFSPLFGSYDESLNQIAEEVKQLGMTIIFDNAQCFGFQTPVADAIVLSWNNKDISGIIGGCILLKGFAVKQNKLKLGQEMLIFCFFLAQTLKRLLWNYTLSSLIKYEYSSGEGLLWHINSYPSAKISSAVALVGLHDVEKYRMFRRRNYLAFKKWCSHSGLRVIETANVDVSPYIPIEVANMAKQIRIFRFFRIKVKVPYGLDDNSNATLRPNLLCVPNHPRVDYSKVFGCKNEG